MMEAIIDYFGSRLQFRPGPAYRYRPEIGLVEFPEGAAENRESKLKLLHEVSHGLLAHDLVSGFDVATMEKDADRLSYFLISQFETARHLRSRQPNQ